jgi:hypothetical protein
MKTKGEYLSSRNAYCWLGFGIGFIGNLTQLFSPGIGWMLIISGLILSVVGCYNWAKAKGRNPLFCLWGLLAPIGFLGTALLQDKWQIRQVTSGEYDGRTIQ